ncbi:MAG: hypothetical protein KAK00_04015, partial [Nanoarchaeota archaeon]|nr:hypothetical protein [Nanoarchaeota archaeon]
VGKFIYFHAFIAILGDIMAIEKEELKKLSLQERIKKLKEIEEEKKIEIEEAEDLIKSAEAEIERNKDVPDIEVPEIEPIDITRIFGVEEGLETTVRREVNAEENTEIKYTPSAEYDAEVGSLWAVSEGKIKEDERIRKFEDSVKYETTADQADDATASRSVHKRIKKYTMG